MSTKITIETEADPGMAALKLAKLLDREVLGPSRISKAIAEGLDAVLEGIEKIDSLIEQEPAIYRSQVFLTISRDRITDAIDILQTLWTELGQI